MTRKSWLLLAAGAALVWAAHRFAYWLFADALTAVMGAALLVLTLGIILAVDWLWCSLVGWILRIPKE
jgi:hypothetical protein